MSRLFWLAMLFAAGVQTGWSAPPAKALLKLHTAEAAAYEIYEDEARTQRLELQTTPVFSWTNVLRVQGQTGQLFVWMRAGRPEVLGTIFSTLTDVPNSRTRMVVHEFHTLSEKKLWPITPKSSRYQWRPQAGIALAPITEAPAVAESAAGRLIQMRNIARTFTGETRNAHDTSSERWELRLLPQPALRYEPQRQDILDGALFLYVTSAGTDPEAVLLVEARGAPNAWKWHYAIARFTDRDLVVRDPQQVVWSSLDDPRKRLLIENDYTYLHSADNTYCCYRSKEIPELPDEVDAAE
ncbi:MAG: hypothetical protein B7Z55_03180 [Planctomycetales bacterium 12-60-4]|nr:MAG: hypothetical protein B7Z55_03180 [Planctomycetales bacterium 12-60-4]